jgi:hypothetical protein
MSRQFLRSNEEIERLKKLIDRDKTGLANGLNAVRQVFQGYFWIPAGEWGSYEWNERTEKNFREEIGRCFDDAEKIAVDALRASGGLANEAFRPDGLTRCIYCALMFVPNKNHPGHLCWAHLASANQAVETWKMEVEKLVGDKYRRV